MTKQNYNTGGVVALDNTSEYLNDAQWKRCEYIDEYKMYYGSNKNKDDSKNDDIIYIKYLQEKGYDKDTIFEEWIELYESEYGTYLGEDGAHANICFKLFWERANKLKKIKRRYAEVYKKDIEYINSLDCKLWIKQFILICLVDCRLRKKFTNDQAEYTKCINFADRSRKDSLSKREACQKLISLGLFKEIKITYEDDGSYYDYYDGIDGECGDGECYDIKYEFVFPEFEKDIAFSVSKLSESKKYTYLLEKTIRICEMCGKKFMVKPKIKRYVCKKCWNKQRLSKTHKSRDAKLNKTSIKKCPVCGQEFEASTKSKTDMCHECLKKDLIKRRNAYRDAWRLKKKME